MRTSMCVFIPLGGLTAANVSAYLEDSQVLAVGGFVDSPSGS